MVPYVSAHQVQVTQKDLITILSEANPLTSSLSQLAQQSIQQIGIYNVICTIATFRSIRYMCMYITLSGVKKNEKAHKPRAGTYIYMYMYMYV